MTDSMISRDALNALPTNVHEKLNETGLLSYLESLIDVLHNEDMPSSEDTEFLHSVLEWTLTVLQRACEPLSVTIFERLRDQMQTPLSDAQNQNWPRFRSRVADYLQTLSSIPTIQPDYKIASTHSVSEDLVRARKRLRTSDTNLRNAYKQAEESLSEDSRNIKVSLENAYAEAQGTLQTEINDTKNTLNATYAEAQGTLQTEFDTTSTNLHNAYAEVQGTMQAEFKLVRESLEEEATFSQNQASAAAQEVAEHRATAETLVSELRQLLNIASDMSWGATYDTSAKRDQRAAFWLRIVSFVLYVTAAGLAVALFLWSNDDPTGDFEWVPRFLIGGPVVILVWAAAYAAKESSEHRNSSRLFTHQSLAFISLDKYATRIAEVGNEGGTGDTKASDFLQDISKSLFTNQIDAHVEQVKAQGRGGKLMMRRLWQRSERQQGRD